ncbi:hypothetical protein [Pinibacter soli]|uniref:DUF4131 domain-containing protein n=1 Tax=Pinibacter soli TaxID=3044211 RepID=A0ABT6R9N7_9BACT|nr:hypothetical protein [Pinibacter soli]MDI3319267.1 hypothetical protein [Pinibacter soli]
MINKELLITTIVFFLIVNTTYYWKGKLGLFAFPAFAILVLVYFGLAIALLRQIYFAIKERLADKKSFFIIGLITIVLALTFFKPFGLINFDRLEGDNVLLAEREGAANCMTTFKLKDDFTFKEQNVCFGVTEVSGKYHLQNDTIYFDNVELGRHENEFYKFAVIKPSKFDNSKILGDLIRYKDLTDTVGHELWITKNELNKLQDKKPNR